MKTAEYKSGSLLGGWHAEGKGWFSAPGSKPPPVTQEFADFAEQSRASWSFWGCLKTTVDISVRKLIEWRESVTPEQARQIMEQNQQGPPKKI